MDIVKFWLVKEKASLNEKLQNNEITDSCIVFVEETREVWTHGQFYGVDSENFKEIEDKITSIQNIIKNEIGPADTLHSHLKFRRRIWKKKIRRNYIWWCLLLYRRKWLNIMIRMLNPSILARLPLQKYIAVQF